MTAWACPLEGQGKAGPISHRMSSMVGLPREKLWAEGCCREAARVKGERRKTPVPVPTANWLKNALRSLFFLSCCFSGVSKLTALTALVRVKA